MRNTRLCNTMKIKYNQCWRAYELWEKAFGPNCHNNQTNISKEDWDIVPTEIISPDHFAEHLTKFNMFSKINSLVNRCTILKNQHLFPIVVSFSDGLSYDVVEESLHQLGMKTEKYTLMQVKNDCFLITDAKSFCSMGLNGLRYAYESPRRRLPKRVPIHPLLMRFYCCSNKNRGFNNRAMYTFVCIVASWCHLLCPHPYVTHHVRIHDLLLKPSHKAFLIYELFHRLVARWETQEMKREEFEKKEKSEMLQAIVRYFTYDCIRWIHEDAVQLLHNIFLVPRYSIWSSGFRYNYQRLFTFVKSCLSEKNHHKENEWYYIDAKGSPEDQLLLLAELYSMCADGHLEHENARLIFTRLRLKKENRQIDPETKAENPTIYGEDLRTCRFDGTRFYLRMFKHPIEYLQTYGRSVTSLSDNFQKQYCAATKTVCKDKFDMSKASISMDIGEDGILLQPLMPMFQFLRILDWCVMRGSSKIDESKEKQRQNGMYIKDPIAGGCNIDPEKVLDTSLMLPVFLSESKDMQTSFPVYMQNAFFVCKTSNDNSLSKELNNVIHRYWKSFYDVVKGAFENEFIWDRTSMLRFWLLEMNGDYKKRLKKEKKELEERNMDLMEWRCGKAVVRTSPVGLSPLKSFTFDL